MTPIPCSAQAGAFWMSSLTTHHSSLILRTLRLFDLQGGGWSDPGGVRTPGCGGLWVSRNQPSVPKPHFNAGPQTAGIVGRPPCSRAPPPPPPSPAHPPLHAAPTRVRRGPRRLGIVGGLTHSIIQLQDRRVAAACRPRNQLARCVRRRRRASLGLCKPCRVGIPPS